MARTVTAPGVPTTRLGKAAFELDDRLIVAGPAARPLPQLPLEIGPDGTVRARGDFDGPVGPGFWSRRP